RTVTVTYIAATINDASNNAGEEHAISASLGHGESGQVQAASQDIMVVEPQLSLQSTISSDTADAGDTLLVTLEISHREDSNAHACDVALHQMLPEGFSLVEGSLNLEDGPQWTGDSQRGDLSLRWEAIELNESVKITFRIVADGSLAPATQHSLDASLDWTSLPADSLGDDDGAHVLLANRTGNPADIGGENNDHVANSSTTIVVPAPTFDGEIDWTSYAHTQSATLTSGEFVSTRYLVDLPDGVAPIRYAIDLADNNLIQWQSLRLEHIGADLQGAGLQGAVATIDGGNAEIDLGTVVNEHSGTDGRVNQIAFVAIGRILGEVETDGTVDVQHTLDFAGESDSSSSDRVLVQIETVDLVPFDSIESTSFIEGSVFVDGDENGVLGARESGVRGVTVKLYGYNDAGELIQQETVTNDRGLYVFGQLAPGEYAVAAQQGDDEFVFSTPMDIDSENPTVNHDIPRYHDASVEGFLYIDYD
ncbi:MAG: SdrD B-like domain-containing protein, partial [Planctomycetota bacterium]